MNEEKRIEEMDDIAEILCDHYDMGTCICNYDVCDLNCPVGRKVERLYDEGYRKQSEVAVEIIDEFKQLAKQFVLDRDLYLVTFKNALNYAETELKKKYVRTNIYENNT